MELHVYLSPIMNMKVEKKLLSSFIAIFLAGISSAKAQNLSDIYELALQNDPALKQAENKLYAIGESKDQSLARFFPVISATGISTKEYLHNKRTGDFRGSLANQDFWSHTFNLNITQPLFHWEHWVQLKQSENQIAQAEATYKGEQQTLMAKTTEAYFNVLSALDNLEFAMAEKEAIGRQLEQAKQRFEVGIIAITDVHEAQAGFDQASANEIEAANNLDNENEALKEIIGDTEVLLDTLGENLPLKKPEPANIFDWSKTAEVNNLSIIAAFNQSEVNRKAIEIQRSGHMPKLDIIGSYGVSDVNSTFGFRGDTQNVGLQLNVPLFEGGAVNSKTRQASFEFEAAKDNLETVKRSVKRQIKEAFRGVMTNISRVEALKAAVTSAETSLEATQAGFEVGTRTMVDVLNEQRNLFKAKRDFSRARYDYLINGIKLKQLSSELTQNDLELLNKLLVAVPQEYDVVSQKDGNKP